MSEVIKRTKKKLKIKPPSLGNNTAKSFQISGVLGLYLYHSVSLPADYFSLPLCQGLKLLFCLLEVSTASLIITMWAHLSLHGCRGVNQPR